MAILKKAPEGANVLDLNAARSARAEARVGQPAPFLKLSAGYVEIKPEVDVMMADHLSNGQIRTAMMLLLADPEDVDAVMKEGLTDEDLSAIVKHSSGKELGESLPSIRPSKKTGNR